MAEILLLSVPYGRSYGKIAIENFQFGYPPLGLSYIASLLASEGCDVKLIDLQFLRYDQNELKILIKNESPKWVGISATTPQINDAFLTAEIVKQVNPNIKTVIGGSHASALSEQTIENKNIDILVYGEGEFTMLDLVKETNLYETKGIFFKNNGKVVKTPPRALVQDINIFPYPLYDNLPIQKYGGSQNHDASLGILSSRGCPYHCTYCAANTIHKRRFRRRSIGNIMGEITMLKQKYGFNRFCFYDDTFTLDKKRTVEICEELIKSKLQMKWYCSTRADSVTKPLLKIMKDAGCIGIHVGVESGDNQILRLAKRQETVEDSIQAITWIKEAGMVTTGQFIIGLPHETPKTIEKTINLAKKLNVDYAQFSVLIPLPGSEVWDLAQKKQLLKIVSPGWENFGRYGNSVISLKDVSPKSLSRYLVKAYREFYLRPSYILKRLCSIRSWDDFHDIMKNAIVFFKLHLFS